LQDGRKVSAPTCTQWHRIATSGLLVGQVQIVLVQVVLHVFVMLKISLLAIFILITVQRAVVTTTGGMS
jgi:hypothetical protein